MSIEHKVRLIELLYDRLEQEITKFKTHSSLHCISGCGKCCTKPTIDASPLEFLPWAFHLFLNGEAEKTLEQLAEKSTPICHIYRPISLNEMGNGSCGNYKYRGLICRLFGYGANYDKFAQLRLATCTRIKENQSESYESTVNLINNGLSVPIFTDYYMNLSQIDFGLGNIIVPINEALKMAIQEVLQYYAYRPLPNGFINAA